MPKNLELPTFLFHQGTAERAYEMLGAHLYREKLRKNSKKEEPDENACFIFRVWAPHAKAVSVVGDFNGWKAAAHPMKKVTDQGIWEVIIPEAHEYDAYKYIITARSGRKLEKSDPYGYHMETRPSTASKLYILDNKHIWNDGDWLKKRSVQNPYNSPMNVYEVHLGSWKRYDDGNYYNYEALSNDLIPYVKEMGYTHIEVMPVTEYPFDGSWGYQVSGYYSPTSRYGTPQGLMEFIDKCHQNDIGVILDWVPGHFPKDSNGLVEYDGGYCYEYADPLKMEHKDWGTRVFDWGKNEVRSFLISNAIFWLDKFHFDGLRIDAVASMLYLDYGRDVGAWRPNVHGGRENLEAIAFFRDLNKAVFGNVHDALMIAEESTSWPMVTKPVYMGGLGFNFKWNMGWMNDTLEYVKLDPVFRKYRHDALTFALTYAFSENYVLTLSHDEVVHMKGSLISRMPGNYEEKFANLRTYLSYMIAHPGKKVIFMGGEFAQFSEWNFDKSLDWNLFDFEMHRLFNTFVKDLNHYYLNNSEFWEKDNSWEGFAWVSHSDHDQNIISFRRMGAEAKETLVICNFSPVFREHYRVGVHNEGKYKIVLNTDEHRYGGYGCIIPYETYSEYYNCYGYEKSITLNVPPLSTLFLTCENYNS